MGGKRTSVVGKIGLWNGQTKRYTVFNGETEFNNNIILEQINNNISIVNGDINIEKLELTGLDFYQTSNVLERSENDIIHNHLNIFGSPLYGRYTLPKTHIYSSLE